MSNRDACPLVLHNRGFLPGSPQRKLLSLLGILLLALVLVCGALISLIALGSCAAARTCVDIGGALWEGLQQQPALRVGLVMAAALVPVMGLLVMGGHRRQRLILTDTKVTYRSPFPGLLNFLQRDWSLQWIDVRRAWLAPIVHFAGPHLTALMLDTAHERRRLLVYPWVDPRRNLPRFVRQEIKYVRELQNGRHPEAITHSPLLQFLKERVRDLEIQPTPKSARPFALEKNPWALACLIGFALLAAYAVVDTFFIVDEGYADGPFYAWYAAAGLVLAIGTGAVLRAKTVPETESVAMAALLGAVFAFALYPGLLRLNALTDSSGFHSYTYYNDGPMQFRPAKANLPILQFTQFPEYWRRFDQGDIYEFELRRGGLDFYQLNMRPITAALQDHYQGRTLATP